MLDLFGLAADALLEQHRGFERLQRVADRAHSGLASKMRKRRVERGVGAVKLRQRRSVNIGEAIEKGAQLGQRLFVGGLIGERGAADEFRRRYLAGLGGLAFDEFLVPRRDGNDQPLIGQTHCRLQS